MGIASVFKERNRETGKDSNKKSNILLHSALSRGFGGLNRKCMSVECFVAHECNVDVCEVMSCITPLYYSAVG